MIGLKVHSSTWEKIRACANEIKGDWDRGNLLKVKQKLEMMEEEISVVKKVIKNQLYHNLKDKEAIE